MPAGSPRRRSQGFTLLEAIVTLVIASLIVVVLMQALQQSLALRTRLLRHERESRMATLQEAWFRDTVSAAVHDLPDAMGAFRGDPAGFGLVSAAPLGDQGIASVRWALEPVEGGAALVYSDPAWTRMPVLPGPLDDARFDYLDANGEWVDAWEPPEPDPDAPPGFHKDLVVLPRMVRLRARTRGGELTWLAPILAEPHPTMLLRPEAMQDVF